MYPTAFVEHPLPTSKAPYFRTPRYEPRAEAVAPEEVERP